MVKRNRPFTKFKREADSHPPLKDFDLGKLQELKDQARKPSSLELATKLADSINVMVKDYNREQRHVKLDLIRAHGKEDYGHVSEWPKQRDLEKYFEIFNELFFFGSLKDSVALILTVHPINMRSHGMTSGPDEDSKCKVQVWDRKSYIPDFETRRRGFLTTLLHELAHAVLKIYACRCSTCTENRGHGLGWQKIAQALEDVINCGTLPMGNQNYDFRIRIHAG